MRGDFSRLRFRSNKNYTSVLQQQGRVALDSDANEQCLINEYIRDTETKDIVGRYAAPVHDEGFQITVDPTSNQIMIGAGRYYVHGILCENGEDGLPYTGQQYLITSSTADADLLNELSVPQPTITAIHVYLEVWRRFVTALDDPCLAEPAIGQADTTARLQTVWRVVAEGAPSITSSTSAKMTQQNSPAAKRQVVSSQANIPGCGGNLADATGTTLLAGSQASASVLGTQAQQATTPCCCDQMSEPTDQQENQGCLCAQTADGSDDCSCQPTPPAGYRGLENQLYRVEIHHPGDETAATFKWSRENASVVVAVTSISGSGSTVYVDSLGMDANLGFSVGQWVEVTDDTNLFGQPPNQPGQLYEIESITPAPPSITLKQAVTGVDQTKNARVRRWDQVQSAGTEGVPVNSGNPSIELENGIQVQFSPGQYKSGNYWLIPARTATGNIDWPPCDSDSACVPPHRTRVFRAPLAYIVWDSSTNQAVVNDCRISFSPLADVDLGFHNKHLHGWGIVCGLQVNCGCDRSLVTVKRGYAIDCDGRDVLMKCDVPVNIVARAQAQSLLDSTGGGNVSLILQRNGSFAIEKEDSSKETLASYLQNTIWVDFWNKCINPLVSFLTSQFTTGPGSGTSPVGPGQQRIDTFLNLIDQLYNPVSGQHVFVSAEEDQVLSTFYAGLKQVLESHTFCGLFDNARPFPAYPFTSLNIHSIFGLGNHTRIRIHPDGTRAYTVGGDNTIHVYDLNNMVMATKVSFPSQTGALVQDVALSADGTQLYAIARLGSNSIFAAASVQGFNLNWNSNSVTTVNSSVLVTLAVNGSTIYALAQGQGIYAITPERPFPSSLLASQSTFGHLVVDAQSNVAYMTVDSNGSTSSFDAVWALDLSSAQGPVIPLTDNSGTLRTGMQGDDLAIAVDPAGKFSKVCVVVEPQGTETTKHLLTFPTDALAQLRQVSQVSNVVDLGQNTAISLDFNPATSFLLLTYADNNWVGVVDPSNNDALSSTQLPTELSPQSIVVGPSLDPSSQTVYVLNMTNSTISTVPSTMLVASPSATVSLTQLATYRNNALNAFTDLLAGLLEDLKDCFCERILVDCPSCNEDDKLYLGAIQIRNNEVYRICNLSRRRYVKTFPTFGYWLSVVPILPLLKWLVEKFCCIILPDYFGQKQAGLRVGAADRLTSNQIMNAKSFVRNINLSSWALGHLAKLGTSGKLVTDSIGAAVFSPKPTAAMQISQDDMLGEQADLVSQRLAAAKIVVDSIEPYDPTATASNVTAFLGAPTNVPSGSHVVLYQQNGVVKYYTLAPKLSPVVQNLTAQIQAQQTTLSSLEQNQQLVADQQKTIAAHEQEIASLKTTLTRLQEAQIARDQEFATLKTKIQNLGKRPAKGKTTT